MSESCESDSREGGHRRTERTETQVTQVLASGPSARPPRALSASLTEPPVGVSASPGGHRGAPRTPPGSRAQCPVGPLLRGPLPSQDSSGLLSGAADGSIPGNEALSTSETSESHSAWHEGHPGPAWPPNLTRGHVGPQPPGLSEVVSCPRSQKACRGCSLGWADSSNSPGAPTPDIGCARWTAGSGALAALSCGGLQS